MVLAYLMECHHLQLVPSGPLEPIFQELHVGAILSVVGLMQPTPPAVVGLGPTSAAILVSCLVGEDPGDPPAVSNPLSYLSHLANSSGDGGFLSEGVSSWVTLLQPALRGYAIWNEGATNQHWWWTF